MKDAERIAELEASPAGEREAFEASGVASMLSRDTEPGYEDQYASPAANMAWRGLQAGAAWQRAQSLRVPDEKPLPDLMLSSYHEAIGWNAYRKALLAAAPATPLTNPRTEVHTVPMVMAADYAALEAECERLRAENIQLIEDRARFPDKPDFIGNMIAAHFGNLRAGQEQAQKYAASHRARMERAEAQRDKLAEALRKVLATHDYHADDGEAAAAVARAALSELTP